MSRGLGWVAVRLTRSLLAELCCVVAAGCPGVLARPLWRIALGLERHCESAALAQAVAAFDAERPNAFAAFETLLRQLANPWNTSASDLHLARLPGRLRRRLGARLVWGRATDGVTLDQAHDATQQQAFRRLARGHFDRALADPDPVDDKLSQARTALDAWYSLDALPVEPPSLRRARAELAWRSQETELAWALITPLLTDGRCPSPFDVLDWGMRAFDGDDSRPSDDSRPNDDLVEVARRCFERATAWLPEARRTWLLGAHLARHDGDRDREAQHLDRALARAPQDVEMVLRRLALDLGDGVLEPLAGRLRLEAPPRLALGETCEILVRPPSAQTPGPRQVVPLPPAGWGLEVETAGDGSTRGFAVEDDRPVRFRVTARRPDRVRGTAWPLRVVFATPEGHCLAETRFSVADPAPGRVLLVATEDHEIHEERGHLDPDLLDRLLVEKSRIAADLAAELGVPWTHFVETGSTLAMGDWAAQSENTSDEQGSDKQDNHRQDVGPWTRLRARVRGHLAEEVARGHDLQPHLHTFNDPAYGHFPFHTLERDPSGWRPSLRFLLTAAEARGDWASATPPPRAVTPGEATHGFDPAQNRLDLPSPTLDRLASVERAVAQLESVARLGSPDHRPILWRSGLLEYGDTREERAWSAVALRRAGLLAASDLAKPRGSGPVAVSPAFPAGWARPFDPVPGGPLLQLPIVANTEGDYRMTDRHLARRASASVTAVAQTPGVHCFTLLTHDKFINARRGGDEFLDDTTTGDWALIRRHFAAWKDAGAQPVTAHEAVEALVDDRGWHPEPRLVRETWVLETAALDTAALETGAHETGAHETGAHETDLDHEHRVRFHVVRRGPRPSASPAQPFPWRIPIPCSLRASVVAVEATLDGQPLETETETHPSRPKPMVDNPGLDAFWVEMPHFAAEPDTGLQVTLQLRHPLQLRTPNASEQDPPTLELESLGEPNRATRTIVLRATAPFLAARALLPWSPSLPQPEDGRAWILDTEGASLTTTPEGLLLTGLRFAADAAGRPEPLHLTLSLDTPSPSQAAEPAPQTATDPEETSA